MEERIRRSFESNYNYALYWARVAVNDIGKFTDEKTPLESICAAFEYLGRAKAQAIIISREYNDNVPFNRICHAHDLFINPALEEVKAAI
jgi:hypothetical protein